MKKHLSNKKMILVVAIITIFGSVAFGYHEFNRGLTNEANMKAETITATELFNNYSANEHQANELYLNKALQVAGEVLEVKINQDQQSQIILSTGDPMFGISCTVENISKTVKTGDHIVIKGICTGYITDVVLTRSILLD